MADEAAARSSIKPPRAKPAAPARGKAGTAQEQAAAALNVADTVVFIANMSAAQVVGSADAMMSDEEEKLIHRGLEKVVERWEAAPDLSAKSGATLLLVGLAMWGGRCALLYRQKHPPKPKAPKPVQAAAGLGERWRAAQSGILGRRPPPPAAPDSTSSSNGTAGPVRPESLAVEWQYGSQYPDIHPAE